MNEVFSQFYEKERLARKEGNIDSLKSIFIEMLKQCNTDSEVISLIKILSVRRGQNKDAIKWLVNEVYEANKENDKFVKALLSEVVEGKMFLEKERVVFTTYLKNKYGDTKEALDIILDVPVETFTLVDDSTIINYQLEQFRLCVKMKDWVKASIIMKRIRQKYFDENNAVDEKIKFFTYKIDLFIGQGRYFSASETYASLNEYINKPEYIILSSFFCLLSTIDNIAICKENDSVEGDLQRYVIIAEEKSKMLNRLFNMKNNTEYMRVVLDKFSKDVLIERSLVKDLKEYLEKYLEFDNFICPLNKAIDEHNYRIIEKFYSIIDFDAFSRLMNLEVPEVIDLISFYVNNKLSTAKIDQKSGTVSFREKKWNSEVDDMLDKLIKVDHLIHKEKMKYE